MTDFNSGLVTLMETPDLSNVTINKRELSNTSYGSSGFKSNYTINKGREKYIQSLSEYLSYDDELKLDQMTIWSFYEILEKVDSSFDIVFDENSISVTDNQTIIFEAHHKNNYFGIEFAKYEFSSFFKLNDQLGGTSNKILDFDIINDELKNYKDGIFR
jgi:hypothetical protein